METSRRQMHRQQSAELGGESDDAVMGAQPTGYDGILMDFDDYQKFGAKNQSMDFEEYVYTLW